MKKQDTELDSPLRGAAAGLLALLPLFAAYEWSLARDGFAWRNAAELFTTLPARLAGVDQPIVRWAVLAALGVGALGFAARSGATIPGALRVVCEGILWAFLLGPLLIFALHGIFGEAPAVVLSGGPPRELPDVVRVSYHLGAAAWEELLFRVLVYGLLFLLGRRGALFLGAPQEASSWVGETLGLLGSAFAFAAFHLELATSWFGPGGEAYAPAPFLWRVAAGLVLGALFRWRGLGVAAWAHGVFNAALILGAGPAVLR